MNKTKPYSIRFDTDKLEYAKLKFKINKEQQLVDFLFEKTYWESKILSNNSEKNDELKLPIDLQKLPEKEAPKSPGTKEEFYMARLRSAKSIDAVMVIITEIENDAILTAMPRIKLKNFAQTVSREMYTD